MNKIQAILTILYVGLISATALAQNGDARFIPDVHIGMAGTQVDGDGLSGFDKLGFNAGLGIYTVLSEKFDAGFELNVFQKGSIRRPDPENGDYRKYKMALFYAEVPVFIRYRLSDKFGLLAGPAFGVLLSAKEFDFDGQIPTDPDFNSFDLSAIFEVQYQFSERLRAGIRTERSLLPIRSKGDTNYNHLKGRQYNLTLGLNLYYTID